MIKKILYKLRKPFILLIYKKSKTKKHFKNYNLSLRDLKKNINNSTKIYLYFHQAFWHNTPVWLKEHRDYFSKCQRGFGEDAFHAAWYQFFKEYHPNNLLEIGIYRGQIISLWSLIGEKMNLDFNIHGISPFTDAGDNVTKYTSTINYFDDVIQNFKRFHLPVPKLHVGFSTDEQMKKVISAKHWDLIYIDGSHDLEIVKQDFEICSKHLVTGGFIVMDDSSLYTKYKPPLYAFAGHPGPSEVANTIENNGFTEILRVGHNRYFQKKQ